PAFTKDLHFAGIVRLEAFEDLDGRGLPGAVRTQQTKTLPPPDVEVDLRHGDGLAEPLLQTRAANRRRDCRSICHESGFAFSNFRVKHGLSVRRSGSGVGTV